MRRLNNNWRKEYQKKMLKDDIEGARKIKDSNLQQKEFSLFRYREFNENNINALKNNQIWMATPDTFNDPFELYFDFTSDYRPIRRIMHKSGVEEERIIRIEKKQDEKLIKFRETTKEKFSFCCFMEEYDSELMWSHYADSHTGFCIEYDFSSPLYYNRVFPVCYYKKAIDFVTWKSKSDFHKVILGKSEAWKYENEWRIINSAKNKGINAAPPIKAIYFGVRAKKDNINRVKKELVNKDIKLYQMKLHPTQYELVAELI